MIPLNRFIITKYMCPHCHEAMKAINFINRYLPYDKQIQQIDNLTWELWGYNSYPFINADDPSGKSMIIDPRLFEGYPFIYVDGHVVEPAQHELLIIFLARLISEDLIMDVNYEGIKIGAGN
jgi:hypothetical protein